MQGFAICPWQHERPSETDEWQTVAENDVSVEEKRQRTPLYLKIERVSQKW